MRLPERPNALIVRRKGPVILGFCMCVERRMICCESCSYLIFFMSSAIQAQTIEERLPECIEEAEELLLRGTRVRAALASESDEDNINKIILFFIVGFLIVLKGLGFWCTVRLVAF